MWLHRPAQPCMLKVCFMPCAQAARHTHSMRSRLADLVDLLLGWSLEPDLPHSTRYPHMRDLVRSYCALLFCIKCIGSSTQCQGLTPSPCSCAPLHHNKDSIDFWKIAA